MRRTKADLRPYQVKGTQFVLNKRYCALFMDMGLGKTIIMLTAIARLLRAGKIDNVLIVGPLRVVQTVWRQEARDWVHTRSLVFSLVHGTHKQRVDALNKPAHVYLINVDGLKWLDQVYGKRKAWPFDMLCVDESSMFKKADTVRFTLMRRRVRDFKRRVVMTGTPTPNGLHEIWPQMFLADRGYFLGPRYTEFKQRFFQSGGYKGYKVVPKEGTLEEITEITSPIVMRLDSADWLTLPKLLDVPVWVELPAQARSVYNTLEGEMFVAFLETGTFVANPHAAALRNRCAQIASGAIYATHEETSVKVWQDIHDAKIDAIKELVDELQGEPPLIVYRFNHDLIKLKKAFPKYAVIGKGVKDRDVMRTVEAWNKGRIDGMLVHPQSVGHGLNLQHGGRHLIWMSVTESTELYLQMLKRLHRSGQKQAVMNYYVLARETVDEVIISDTQFKVANQGRVNAAYRNSTFAKYMDHRTTVRGMEEARMLREGAGGIYGLDDDF